MPIDTYLQQADMDNVNKVLKMVMAPMGSDILLGTEMLSRIMSMLPLNSAEWGL